MTDAQWYETGTTTFLAGRRVFYRRAGAGEALFCLHGFPSSSWDFSLLWPALTARFEALAPDLIGLGRSAKPRERLTVALQADMVESLAAALGIRTAHLLAHDLGDTVAQELLARQREGTATVTWRSCVLLNGGLFPETHRPRPIQRLLLSPLGPLVARLSTERVFRRNMHRIFSPHYPPGEDFLRATWQLLIGDNGRAMLPLLIRYIRERRKYRARWVAPLVEATVPVRLIVGALDPVSGRHLAARFAAVVPRADIVLLADGGHYPHLETPERVMEAILAFHRKKGEHGDGGS